MLNYPLASHLEHAWEQVGRCVYCKICGIRLYQGKVPRDQEAKKTFVEALDAAIAKALEQRP